MRALAFAFTFAAVLLVGAMVLSDAPAQERAVSVPAAGGAKVGYVDLTRVLRDYGRRIEFEEDIKSLQTTLAAREKELVGERTRLQAEIEQLAMGTTERNRLEKQNTKLVEELAKFRKENMDLLNKKFVATITLLYDDVLREVDAFGQENDYDLIIKDQSSEAAATTHDGVVLQVTKRVVLYSKPEYDLSTLIVKRLNEKHRKNQARTQEKLQPRTLGNPPVEER